MIHPLLQNRNRSIVYTFTKQEMTSILEQLVKDKTGVDVKLHVEYYDEFPTDVYVKMKGFDEFGEDIFSAEQWEKIEQLINPQEWFITRDTLVQELTGTEMAHLEWSENEGEEVTFLLWIREEVPQDSLLKVKRGS